MLTGRVEEDGRARAVFAQIMMTAPGGELIAAHNMSSAKIMHR